VTGGLTHKGLAFALAKAGIVPEDSAVFVAESDRFDLRDVEAKALALADKRRVVNARDVANDARRDRACRGV